MTSQNDSIELLVQKATELEYLIGEHLAEWPSARLSHARPTYLVAALRKEGEEVQRKADRQAELAVIRERNTTIRNFDAFTVDMAARFRHTERTDIAGYQPGDIGCTPQEFVDWQRRRQAAMRNEPSLDEQLARAKKELA